MDAPMMLHDDSEPELAGLALIIEDGSLPDAHRRAAKLAYDRLRTEAEPVRVTDAMVASIHEWVCDDVLPAYGVSGEAPSSDIELAASVRAALEAALQGGDK